MLITKRATITGTSLGEPKSIDSIDYLLSKVLLDDDAQAFERLFMVGYHPLLTFCEKLVDNTEVAEELVSEVFLKIWINRHTITISRSPKSYLYTSVRNISFDYLRKVKRYTFTNLDDATSLPCDNFDPQKRSEYEELQVSIASAVAKLPKQCRQVYQLSRDHGLQYVEIAAELQLSVKTIETQMSRALKSLRKSLSHYILAAS